MKYLFLFFFTIASFTLFAQADTQEEARQEAQIQSIFKEFFQQFDTTGMNFPEGMFFQFNSTNEDLDSLMTELYANNPFQSFFGENHFLTDSLLSAPFSDFQSKIEMIDMQELMNKMEEQFKEGGQSFENFFGEEYKRHLPETDGVKPKGQKKRKVYSL